MRKRPAVNWGRYRLREHESVFALVAKFAVLNGLTSTAATKFIVSAIEGSSNDLAISTDTQVKKLAALLDEPINVVASLQNVERFDIERQPGLLAGSHRPSDRARYCVQCVSVGFHGFFHQFPSLALCPIHHHPLSVSSGARGGTLFDRIIRNLIAVFQQKCTNWPAAPKLNRRSAWSPAEKRQLQSYLDWSRDARNRIDELSDKIVWQTAGEQPYLQNDTNKLRSKNILSVRLACFDSPAGMLDSVIPVPSSSIAKKIFPLKNAGEAAGILRRAYRNQAIDLYQRWWAWTKQVQANGKTLDELIATILHDHNECTCYWALNVYDGWFREDPRHRGESSYRCPYQQSANFLTRKWSSFHLLMRRSAWMAHANLFLGHVKDIAAAGWISFEIDREYYTAEEPLSHMRITWHFPQSLMEIIEECLSTELSLDYSACMAWIASIDNGCDPGKLKCMPPALTIVPEKDSLIIYTGNHQVD